MSPFDIRLIYKRIVKPSIPVSRNKSSIEEFVWKNDAFVQRQFLFTTGIPQSSAHVHGIYTFSNPVFLSIENCVQHIFLSTILPSVWKQLECPFIYANRFMINTLFSKCLAVAHNLICNHPFLFFSFLFFSTVQMDSKKSPLALLAQTCSAIGASDPQVPLVTATGSKSVVPQPATTERKKSTSESQRDKTSPLSVGGSSSDSGHHRVQQPISSNSSAHNESSASSNKSSVKKSSADQRLTPSGEKNPTDHRRSKSISPKNRSASSNGLTDQTAPTGTTSATATNLSTGGNGLMSHPSHPLMMAGDHPSSAAALSLASYKSLMAGMPFSAGSPYPPFSNAGFGAGLSPGYPPHPSALDLGAYASALNAVAKSSVPMSFPTSAAAAMMSGYLATQHPAYSAALAMQYGRMKNPSLFTAPSTTPTDGGNCRDPYCTGCPSSNNNNNNNSASNNGQSSTAGGVHMICTAGCGLSSQCDHLKVPIPAHHLTAGSTGNPAGPATSPLGPPSSPHTANTKPYVCNWIVGDNYCGKRFHSSDDLLQHLRTHTNLSSTTANSDPALTHPSMVPTSSSAVPFAHPSSLMRAYPTPPLSPLSAARYHPYGKNPVQQQQQQQQQQQTPPSGPSMVPPGFPAGLFHPHHPLSAMAGSSPYSPSALFPHPALAPYYSHLSLFAPRGVGSAPLPP